jgi:RNA-directed DNA polymerase
MQNQLPIKSLRDLEHRLGVSREVLRALAERVELHYSPFFQEKKSKPFQRPRGNIAKKQRPIDNPSKELKRLQKLIDTKLLKPLALPNYLHGAVRKRTIKTNALEHLGAKTLVKMDITQFFPNVHNTHVYRIWTSVLGCSPRIGNLLTKLTTYKRRLPQGAPTSSSLANIFLASSIPAIEIESRAKDVRPSAFVDDLAFSGEKARDLMEPTRQRLAQDGLKLASKKRKIYGPKDSKTIAGVRLGGSTTRMPHEKMKDFRAGIHKLALGVSVPKGRKKYLGSIQAKIRHASTICESDGKKLQRQLDKTILKLRKSAN